MSQSSAISKKQILKQVGERSYRLGEQYFESGAIFDARREGETLKARCQGSSGGPYRVQVTLGKGGLAEADCSCPVGGGGSCKHVAAMLLTWLDRPEEFVEVEPIEQSLEQRSKGELIALIKQMLRREPELESLLAAPLPGSTQGKPAKPEVYKRQAEAVFRNAEDRWGVESDIADQVLAISEIGDDFLKQGDFASAAAVFQGVSSAVLDNYETFNDEEGSLGGVVMECVEGLGRGLASAKDAAPTRESILRALFDVYRFDIDFGGVGLSDEVPELILKHATPDERCLVTQWVRQAMPKGKEWSDNWHREAFGGFLLELEADTLDDEAFLRIARETGRVHDLVDRLLKLGRVEEAIGEAEKADDYGLLGLADVFVAHGHDDAAEGLILKRSRTSQDIRILEWLRKRALARHDEAEALKLSEQIFHKQPSAGDYEQIKKLASKVGQWDAWRKQLLSALQKMNRSDLLIQIHLREKQIDEALKVLRSAPRGGWWGGSMELEVAKAAEKTHPREALAIYRKRAERLVDQRGRESYREACTYLKKIKSLYAQMGEGEAWATYIAELREKNGSLRALLEELNKAKL